jgi:hypothetical protein
MEQHNIGLNSSDQMRASREDPITHLLSVALVSKKFRRLLLTDPEQALDEGHRGEQFHLNPADRKRILMTHARSLEELAAKLIQATDEQAEEERISLQAESAMPLYQQLYTHLQQSIEQGTLEVGAQLPSERRIATECGISRLTARKAFQLLAQQGYVVTHQGKGSYVMWGA